MEKLYKIGELASACNTTLKTIRYYEEKGLIKHCKVDSNNGYHYYNFETLVYLQKIIKLKELGFSLEEIKNYNIKSNKEKIEELENLLKTTNEKINKLYTLEYSKSYHLPYFINDEKALGLWKSVAHAKSIEDYKNGIYNENTKSLCFKYLYFLNNGKGFGRIVDWSKGKINIGFKNTHTYIIENDKLYLNLVNTTNNEHEKTIIYERIDNKKRDIAEPIFQDDVKMELTQDNDVVGLWEIYDVVHKLDKNSYSPSNPKDMSHCFYQSIIFKTNNWCIKEQFAELIRHRYTKGKVLDRKHKMTEDYKIIKEGANTYLLIDCKNDDYLYDNTFTWTYVFKKV